VVRTNSIANGFSVNINDRITSFIWLKRSSQDLAKWFEVRLTNVRFCTRSQCRVTKG